MIRNPAFGKIGAFSFTIKINRSTPLSKAVPSHFDQKEKSPRKVFGRALRSEVHLVSSGRCVWSVTFKKKYLLVYTGPLWA